MYFAYPSSWAELLSKFNTKCKVLNVFWNWPVRKGGLNNSNFVNRLSNLNI